MNTLVFLGVIILLVFVLILIGTWQEKIEEFQERRALEALRDARDLGTETPLAQHPIIDIEACIGCGSCVAACPEEGVLGLVDGVARVIHGARCVGHARCAAVCPVAAIQVGLGEARSRSDVPQLTEELETTVPGVYIAGELGGFALIRIAVEQGVKAMNAIADDLARQASSEAAHCDVLIVGAGPAGIAASLRARELGLHAVTIDQESIGGTVRKYPRRKLVLTEPVDLPLHGRVKRREFLKEELIELWEQIIERHGLEIHTGVKLEAIEPGLVAKTSEGELRSRRVLLALGRRGTPRKLGAPGEELEKVLYHLLDTAGYRHEHILVVGGGDSAVEAATGLANQSGNRVTLSYRRDRFVRLKPRNLQRIEQYQKKGKLQLIFSSEVECIEPDSVTLRTQSGESVTLPNTYVFVFAGGEPPYPLLSQIGVQFGSELEAMTEVTA